MLHVAKTFATSLDQAQDHATKFFVTPHTIPHVTESFATPHLFFEMLLLLLGTLLHVLKMIAIESQKLITNTSDVVGAKVTTTGETTTPSSLINAFPSINAFIAGDLHAHDLL